MQVERRDMCISADRSVNDWWGWRLDLIDQSYFWTRKRWAQHEKGIQGIEPPPEEDEPGKEIESPCTSKVVN